MEFKIQIIACISVSILVVMHFMFFSYPLQKKRILEASDEDERTKIKTKIMLDFIRVISMILATIFIAWLYFNVMAPSPRSVSSQIEIDG